MYKLLVICWLLGLPIMGHGSAQGTLVCPRLMVVTIPKAGAHLLLKIISCLTNAHPRRGTMNDFMVVNPQLEYITQHLPYSQELAKKITSSRRGKGIFLYRDPRAQVVSMAHFIKENPDFYKPFYGKLVYGDIASLVTVLIGRVDKLYRSYLPWQKHRLFYSLKFEDLVGIQGGGRASMQKRAIKALARHLGISSDSPLLDRCLVNAFGNSITFREGKINGWKRWFTAEHKRLFKEKAGQLLVDLKYENNLNW
jgi:sulfotransferase 6B1